jgi:polar amino acid transport system ATP-binding protein
MDRAMLFVTHETRVARDVADRVLTFDHGPILKKGPRGRILSSPRQERTRAFLMAVLERDEAPNAIDAGNDRHDRGGTR